MLQLIIIDILLLLLPVFLLAASCLTLLIKSKAHVLRDTQRPNTRQRKHYTPMLFPLLGCIAGITIQSNLPIPMTLSIAGTIFAAHTLLKYQAIQNSLKVWSLILFFFAGAVIYQLNYTNYNVRRNTIKNREISVMGVITDKQDWNNDWKKGEVLHIHISGYHDHTTNTNHNLSFNLLCYLHRKTSLQVDDKVQVKDITLLTKKQASFSGNPTYDDYLKKQNIMGSLFIKRLQVKLLSRPDRSLLRWLWKKRNALYTRLTKKLTSLSGSLFGLIFLGNKQTDQQDKLKTIFNYWGLDHYLARSGLHIVLFVIIWSLFLQLIPIHLSIKRILLMIICLAYTLLSWSSLSFTRALLIFFLVKTGELLFRPVNFLHLLSLCCLSILLYNPLFLFFLDFQLTFGLTFTLAFLSELIRP